MTMLDTRPEVAIRPQIEMPVSKFAADRAKFWKHRYDVTLFVVDLTGGVPGDERLVEGWIKAQVTDKNSDLIRERIAEAIVDRGLDKNDAVEEVAKEITNNAFRRTREGYLFIGGYQAKAAIKEALSIAVNGGHIPAGQVYGAVDNKTLRKTLKKWAPEHVQVPEDRILVTRDGVPLTVADEVFMRFVHARNISAIVREEVVHHCELSFQVWTDTDDLLPYWSAMWNMGEMQGIGAARSLGRGKYVVTRWDKQA